MPINIIHDQQKNYPLKETDLKIGQIYEGSDKLLYVAAGGGHEAESGYELVAVQINGDHYISTDPRGPESITFREVDVNLTILN